jgi:hypothetical protein
MVFLGPLREEPKPVYPVPDHISLSDFGKRGENTAALLYENHRRMVVCLTPQDLREKLERIQKLERIHRKREEFQSELSVEEEGGSYDIEFILIEQSMPLQQAVSEWLNYLGLAEQIESVDKGALGHQLKIRIRGSSVSDDLMHVGVGISQVLPILVGALLAPKGSSLLLEQPELHLHPSVQTKLADFFLSLTMMDKQCIIETHSEHIVNRLRLRMVQLKETPFNPTQHICIYFARKENDESLFEEITFDENEVITNWPEGFFDQFQQDQDEIRRAKAEGAKSQLRQQERMLVEELIKKGECETIEFKSTLRWNIKADKKDPEISYALIKTIAAFLNTRGGTLLVGVDDKGIPLGLERDGFDNSDKMRLFLTGLVKDHIGT